MHAIQTSSCRGDKRVLTAPAKETGKNVPCRTHKTGCAVRAFWLVFRRRVYSVWTFCYAATGRTDRCQACTPGPLSCTSGTVLTCWLLLSELGKHWNCRQILVKCSCQSFRWFWSCYRQTVADRLVGALLQPSAFVASTNICCSFCTNYLKLVCYCCPSCNMLELSTARHVLVGRIA